MMPIMNKSCPTVYGIRNCDTVKKARLWLTEQKLEYQFHDFKALGVPAARLDQWLTEVAWEKLLNRQGNTWRKLDPATQRAVLDAASARAVMLANPSVIKRPVVEWNDMAPGSVTVGFQPESWAARLVVRAGAP